MARACLRAALLILMRVSNNMLTGTMITQLNRLGSRQVELQNQASTGQKLLSPEDDPAATRRVLNADGVIVAGEIEVEVEPVENGRVEFAGIIASLPTSGLVGDWQRPRPSRRVRRGGGRAPGTGPPVDRGATRQQYTGTPAGGRPRRGGPACDQR